MEAHKQVLPPLIGAAAERGRTWIYDPGSIESEIDLIDTQLQMTRRRRGSLLNDASQRLGLDFDTQSATPIEDALQGFAPDSVIVLATMLSSLSNIQSRKEPRRRLRDADSKSASKAFLGITRQFLAANEAVPSGKRSPKEHRHDTYMRKAATAYRDLFSSLITRAEANPIKNRDFKVLLEAEIETARTTLSEPLIKTAQAVAFEHAHIKLIDDKIAELEGQRVELCDWRDTMKSLWDSELGAHKDVVEAVRSYGKSVSREACAGVVVGLFMSGPDRAIAVRSL